MVALALLSVILYIPVWIDDAEARRNRDRVNNLISVGQDFDEAQRVLRDAGFQLVYGSPIKPTIAEDFFSQLVIVGDTRHNAFETIGYVIDVSWMPFTRTESSYVHIRASLEGVVTDID